MEEKLFNGLINKMNKNNFNDLFDKQLLDSLKLLKKVSNKDYLIDLFFCYKNIIFLHYLLSFTNSIAIFSEIPIFINGRNTIFYSDFYKIYLYNKNYISINFQYIYNDFISRNKEKQVKFSIKKIEINEILRIKGKLIVDLGIVKTPYYGAKINNCDDYEGGFYLNFIYGKDDKDLKYNIENNNYYYNLGFFIGKEYILITSIHRKLGFYVPLKISVLKFFMIFLSLFEIKLIGLGDNLAFSRNHKGYGFYYNKIYNKYDFYENNGLYEKDGLKKYLYEKKIYFNEKINNIINDIFYEVRFKNIN